MIYNRNKIEKGMGKENKNEMMKTILQNGGKKKVTIDRMRKKKRKGREISIVDWKTKS